MNEETFELNFRQKSKKKNEVNENDSVVFYCFLMGNEK